MRNTLINFLFSLPLLIGTTSKADLSDVFVSSPNALAKEFERLLDCPYNRGVVELPCKADSIGYRIEVVQLSIKLAETMNKKITKTELPSEHEELNIEVSTYELVALRILANEKFAPDSSEARNFISQIFGAELSRINMKKAFSLSGTENLMDANHSSSASYLVTCRAANLTLATEKIQKLIAEGQITLKSLIYAQTIQGQN